MKKSIVRFFSISISALALCLLVSSPETAALAVKSALNVCTGIILPSLLPFFFISGIISSLGIPQILARLAQRPMKALFGFSGYACTPLMLGLLGGYPVGAASLAELVRENKLSREEGQRLLPVCNNTGPAFIIGAVGGGIFSSAAVGLMLYAVHILSALSLGILFSSKNEISQTTFSPEVEYSGLVSALPGCIKGAVEKCLNICGFVIFFSILGSLLDELGLISSAALALSKGFGLEIGFCRCLLAGIMELGSGIASMSALSACPANYALAAFILGFGSLSVHCQTLAVISGTNMKCARHFAGRIIHGALSALFAYVISSLLRI